MKRPITTAEYFNLICDTLRRKKQMPDEMLDYALPTYSPVPIKTYEFNIRNNLDFGENVFHRCSSFTKDKSSRS